VWILVLIFALLLLLFGGGCTVILGGLLLSDPANIASELELALSIWLPLGLLPMIGGWFLFLLAMNLKRQKQEQDSPQK
jgi:hypothetical protein